MRVGFIEYEKSFSLLISSEFLHYYHSLSVRRIQLTVSGGKGKAAPLQAWNGPDASRKLRFPDLMTTAQDSGKVVNLTHRPPLPQEMLLVLISVRV